MLSLKNNKRGFTIIEVLIVLAIAGIIMVIVFLAVPALQRNSRNTSRRSDASKALAAVGEFSANNSGKVPVTADLATLTSSANLSSGTTLNAAIATTVATVGIVGVDEIQIGTGLSCNTAAAMVTATPPFTAVQFQGIVQAASSRSVVALFSIESTGGQRTTQCLAS